MKKKTSEQPYPRLLDFPSSMSGYERESLAAEARLAAERKLKKLLKDLPKPSHARTSL
jgi:hypothetical protein